MSNQFILLTCEHAKNHVPKFLNNLNLSPRLLSTHRAYDKGALEIARALQLNLKAPLLYGQYSRLAIDLNRSEKNSKVFSKFSRVLKMEQKEQILSTIYRPFRKKTNAIVKKELGKKKLVVHFSIHSFTPIMNQHVRNCEIGLLYDPKYKIESSLARKLKHQLSIKFPNIRIRMNYPYKGTADGHTSNLRKIYGKLGYVGIEIEFNQAWLKYLESHHATKKASLIISKEINKLIHLKNLRSNSEKI